jgi:hypothetical protein
LQYLTKKVAIYHCIVSLYQKNRVREILALDWENSQIVAMDYSLSGNSMDRQLLRDSLGWGLALWFIGYLLGIIFFFFVPSSLIGWAIMPIGIIITIFVLLKIVKDESLRYYLILAVAWTAIAISLDYIFIVKAFNPADGYYKLDVYLYYAITFASPLIVGLWKRRNLLRSA